MKYIRLLLMALFCVSFVSVSGCGGSPVKPFETAETPRQKAYVVLRTYEIYQHQARELYDDPNVDASVKRVLVSMVEVSAPTIKALHTAYEKAMEAHEKWSKAEGTLARLQLADAELVSWMKAAEETVNRLKTVVEGI